MDRVDSAGKGGRKEGGGEGQGRTWGVGAPTLLRASGRRGALQTPAGSRGHWGSREGRRPPRLRPLARGPLGSFSPRKPSPSPGPHNTHRDPKPCCPPRPGAYTVRTHSGATETPISHAGWEALAQPAGSLRHGPQRSATRSTASPPKPTQDG